MDGVVTKTVMPQGIVIKSSEIQFQRDIMHAGQAPAEGILEHLIAKATDQSYDNHCIPSQPLNDP